GGRDRPVELVGLAPSHLEGLRKFGAEGFPGAGRNTAQPQSDDGTRPCPYAKPEVCGDFSPGVVRVDGLLPIGHDAVVDAILDVGSGIGGPKQTLVVGLVLGKQQERVSVAIEEIVFERCVRRGDDAGVRLEYIPQRRLRLIRPPCPSVAEPERWQNVYLAFTRPAIMDADLDQYAVADAFAYSTKTSKYRS